MSEIKRLQQLAGINEIKVNNPIQFNNGDRVRILVDVYYDEEEGEAVPRYEIEGRVPKHFWVYIERGEEGTYEEDEFESDSGSTSRIDTKYLQKI
jgi:hypothetical protein